MEEEVQVVIVGGKLNGEDKEIHELQELAKKLEIAHRVRFVGAQPRQEMPLVYSAADVTVMPSYHESFGLVAVESLACGVPVVATRAGGLTMIVRHNETGFLVPRCPGFFAERLDALLRDKRLRAQMSDAARPSVQQFSWRSVGRQVGDMYEELADKATCLVAQ
jgi:D-inositol-3-phosphate glycosyltransferase